MTRLRSLVRATPAGWLLIAVAFVVLMVIGSQRDSSPATPQERVEAVARRLACPTCDGESVSESRGTASQAIRQEISRLVAEGMLSDDEIVATIDDNYAESLRLTPGSSGIEALVWVLPVAVGGVALAGLVIAFRRWRAPNRGDVSTQPSEPVEQSRELSSSARTRVAISVTVVVVLSVIAGIAIARNSGERRPGQVMTGGSGEASITSLLVEARSLGMADLETALGLYAQVLEQEPDNIEALTYFGWLTVLSAPQIEDQGLAAERLESGLVLLRQATIIDTTYPDAHCFLGISFFRFLGDAEAAAPEIDTCLASNPPAEVATLVEGLAAQIEESLGGSPTAPDDSLVE
ncbi:MAG: cytochrome c biosis protein CcmH [Actinomycetota bacterium]